MIFSHLNILDDGPESEYVIVPRWRLHIQYSVRDALHIEQGIEEHALDLLALGLELVPSCATEARLVDGF